MNRPAAQDTVGTMHRSSIFAPLTALVLLVLLLVPAFATYADEAPKPKFHPAVIYLYSGDMGDSAFINSARSGIGQSENEFHISVALVRMKTTDDLTATIKKVADGGANPIILLGNQNVTPVMNLAERYPNTNFTIIDGLAPPLYPNVQSILFKDHEGAFLVGMIAGKLSKTGFVGFVGGMDIPAYP